MEPLTIGIIGGGTLLVFACMIWIFVVKKKKQPAYPNVVGDLVKVRSKSDGGSQTDENDCSAQASETPGEAAKQPERKKSEATIVTATYTPGDRVFYDEESFDREVISVDVKTGTIVMSKPPTPDSQSPRGITSIADAMK